MYKCECGREFSSSQSLNGHKGHCKIHLGESKYEQLANIVRENQLKATKARSEQIEKKSNNWLISWVSEQHTCEQCGKVMTEYYGSGRFCCRSCSNKWVVLHQSPESKARKVEAGKKNLVLGRIKGSGCCNKKYWTREAREHHSSIMTRVMANPEIRKKISDRLAGRVLSKESRDKISRKVTLSHAEGRNKGWTTRRNQESYAEKFWRSVLDSNDISYQQEFKVNKPGPGCYFLDFFVTR